MRKPKLARIIFEMLKKYPPKCASLRGVVDLLS